MNKHIIVSVVLIGSSGVIKAWQSKKPLTPVLLGAYVLLLVLSVADMFGGAMSTIAGAIALLAAVGVIINDWTPILATATKAVGGK